jgi:hypothetical protein
MYKCNVCNYNTNLKGGIYSHYKRKHNNLNFINGIFNYININCINYNIKKIIDQYTKNCIYDPNITTILLNGHIHNKKSHIINKNINKNIDKKLLNVGILSWTFDNNTNKLKETKIYRYSSDKPNISGSYNKTILLSNKRNYIPQYDIKKDDKIWNKKINKNGKKILNIYKKNNYHLDTISYQDINHFTLYFPKL